MDLGPDGVPERDLASGAVDDGSGSDVADTEVWVWVAPPRFLERRRRIDEAPLVMVVEAYLHGVSTREVDEPVKGLGDSEDGAFGTAFLRGLKARRLGGVQLVISDAHAGLKQAMAAFLTGSSWQRSRVHFMRLGLAVVLKDEAEMVADAIRTIFAQPDAKQLVDGLTFAPGCLDLSC